MSNPNQGQPTGSRAAREATQQRLKDDRRVQRKMQDNRQRQQFVNSVVPDEDGTEDE